jgi:hypothetical protein
LILKISGIHNIKHPFVQRGNKKDNLVQDLVKECLPLLLQAREKKKNKDKDKGDGESDVNISLKIFVNLFSLGRKSFRICSWNKNYN